jgi:hypothetical protein
VFPTRRLGHLVDDFAVLNISNGSDVTMKPTLSVFPLLFAAPTVVSALTTSEDLDVQIESYTVVKGWKWYEPWTVDDQTVQGYDTTCKAVRTFEATQYKLKDMKKDAPQGLAPWAEYLAPFYASRPYPGSWEGIDHGEDNRELLMMEFKDVPKAVKDWLDQQVWGHMDNAGKLQFIVEEKHHLENPAAKAAEVGDYTHDHDHDSHRVMFFPPGALYDILPLWVADDSNCKGMFQRISPNT